MKKRILLLSIFSLILVASGCRFRLAGSEEFGSGGGTGIAGEELPDKPTPEELLERYADGINERDVEKVLSVIPDFMHDYFKEYMINSDFFERSEEEYGSDFKYSYIYEEMANVDDGSKDHFVHPLSEINESIKEMFKDQNYVLASECYELYGGEMVKGSKKSFEDGFEGIAYCNFGGVWRLLLG